MSEAQKKSEVHPCRSVGQVTHRFVTVSLGSDDKTGDRLAVMHTIHTHRLLGGMRRPQLVSLLNRWALMTRVIVSPISARHLTVLIEQVLLAVSSLDNLARHRVEGYGYVTSPGNPVLTSYS